MIAVPLIIQTNLIFWIGYRVSKLIGITYEETAPASMIGASNHFEVAIATVVILFGLESGAALSTVVGVLTKDLSFSSFEWEKATNYFILLLT